MIYKINISVKRRGGKGDTPPEEWSMGEGSGGYFPIREIKYETHRLHILSKS